jgi:hypothetical protein
LIEKAMLFWSRLDRQEKPAVRDEAVKRVKLGRNVAKVTEDRKIQRPRDLPEEVGFGL